MFPKKTYYSISEVSKILNIQEHTIRFWNSKLPDLSKRDNKGKTRFFNLKQIEKPTFRDPFDWLCSLAYQQFTPEEYDNGTAVKILKDIGIL